MSSQESQPINNQISDWRAHHYSNELDEVLLTRKKSHCERLSVASNDIGLATFVIGGFNVGMRVARYRPTLMGGSC